MDWICGLVGAGAKEGVLGGPLRRKGMVWARQFMCRTNLQRGSASDMSMPGWLVLVGG